MPRNGLDIYELPPGTYGEPDQTIYSGKYNTYIDDIAVDLNTPRPIKMGGTGATTPEDAMTNLGGAQFFTQVDPPLDPSPNTLWWDSDNGVLYIYYVDADSSQWVQVSAAPIYDIDTLATKDYVDTEIAETLAYVDSEIADNILSPQNVRGFFNGFNVVSFVGASLAIDRGTCTDRLNNLFITSANSMTKTNAPWVQGTGGGRDDGVGPWLSGWQHIHVIKRPDTGVVDFAFSASHIAPTLGINIPVEYTLSRRIGAAYADGSGNFIPYIQSGDRYEWVNAFLNANGVACTTTPMTVAVSVPPSVVVHALLSICLVAGVGQHIYFYDLAKGDQAAGPPNISLSGVTGTIDGGMVTVRTDGGVSNQVGVVSSASSGSYYVGTQGWIDQRHRFGF